jgi:proteasome lid subunit RPN8/RPN11
MVERLLAHAREMYPNECCGILGGAADEALHQYRISNVDPYPTVRYRMDTREQLWAYRNMRHNGLVPIAVYHSHAQSDAFPSPTDIELALDADVAYIIVSLIDPAAPRVRAFRIRDAIVTEAPLSVLAGLRHR